MRYKNAQAWGFDLIIAVMIFLVGIVLFYLYTINYPSQGEETLRALQYEAELVSDSLLSEGSPENWQSGNVVRIGILTQGKINQTKLENFNYLATTNYNKTKTLFRIRNEYYIQFQNPITLPGGPVTEIGFPATNPQNLIKISRIAIYQNNLTALHFNIWN